MREIFWAHLKKHCTSTFFSDKFTVFSNPHQILAYTFYKQPPCFKNHAVMKLTSALFLFFSESECKINKIKFSSQYDNTSESNIEVFILLIIWKQLFLQRKKTKHNSSFSIMLSGLGEMYLSSLYHHYVVRDKTEGKKVQFLII